MDIASRGLALDVSYHEKDKVKALGARWDPEFQTWFVPSNKSYFPFMKWVDDGADFILKGSLYVIRGERKCWKCARITPVICLGADSKSERLKKVSVQGDTKWLHYCSLDSSIFKWVTYLSRNVVEVIEAHMPTFQYGYSYSIDKSYYANHCNHCGALQGDNHLHHEVDSIFWPSNEAEWEELDFIEIKTKYDCLIGSN